MEDQRKEGGEVVEAGPLCREGVSQRRWESEGIRSRLEWVMEWFSGKELLE